MEYLKAHLKKNRTHPKKTGGLTSPPVHSKKVESPRLQTCKRKVHLRLQAAHDLRNRFARSTGVRPAQRAVAGVEVKIGQFAFANDRHVARGCRAQARPEAGLRGIPCARKQLFHAAHDGFAAHAVQIAVIAVELCRARNAQAYSSSVSET
jgi:hypothetical protein